MPTASFFDLYVIVAADTSSCKSLSLEEGKSTVDWKGQLFPNPTNRLVELRLSQQQNYLSIRIRNLQGQLIQEEQYAKQQHIKISIDGKPGIYFIEAINEKGEKANWKVIKQ